MYKLIKLGFQSANSINFTAQTQENKTTNIDYKKYLTAPNIILGSLATIGVLGMADILLCKGKHINKLTGKGKELEEALSKNNTLQEKLSNTEAKLVDSEKLIKELNEKIEKLPQNLKLHESKDGYRILRDYHKFATDVNTPVELQKEMKDALYFNGYRFVEYNIKDFDKFNDKENVMNYCFDFFDGSIKEGKTTVPALIFPKKNGEFEIICTGKYVSPRP